MEKLLVEIFVPAAGVSHDVYIPLGSKMNEVLILVSKVITELSEGKYIATRDAVLCDRDSGVALNINMSAAELGIKNGSRLMLI